jgi:hypothetical protein
MGNSVGCRAGCRHAGSSGEAGQRSRSCGTSRAPVVKQHAGCGGTAEEKQQQFQRLPCVPHSRAVAMTGLQYDAMCRRVAEPRAAHAAMTQARQQLQDSDNTGGWVAEGAAQSSCHDISIRIAGVFCRLQAIASELAPWHRTILCLSSNRHFHHHFHHHTCPLIPGRQFGRCRQQKCGAAETAGRASIEKSCPAGYQLRIHFIALCTCGQGQFSSVCLHVVLIHRRNQSV